MALTEQHGKQACERIMKHTPGPWILGGRMITTPSGYVGDGFIADVDTLANAKLIATAPELLDAAIYAVECLQRMNDEFGQIGDSGYQALSSLSAAINKAIKYIIHK